MRYHSITITIFYFLPKIGEKTVSGGQFDWGGRLLKSNGGVQRFSQIRWKVVVEWKGIRKLNCKTNKSNRDASRS
jgi:hypothetical protein